MVVHASDTELRLALGQFGRLGDLLCAEVDSERIGAYRGRPASDITEATAELHVLIASLESGIEKQRAGSLVMDLADDPQPRVTGPARIENVLVTVGRHRGGRLTQFGDVFEAGVPGARD